MERIGMQGQNLRSPLIFLKRTSTVYCKQSAKRLYLGRWRMRKPVAMLDVQVSVLRTARAAFAPGRARTIEQHHGEAVGDGMQTTKAWGGLGKHALT